jgi:membrane-associated protease RseP (regulator of RpoE activity)
MYLGYLISFVIVLFIHELGHLVAAKACRVPADEFGLGWGRELKAFRWGGVTYKLHLLPIGAYVRMDMNVLQTRPLSQQVLVLLAGPIVNLVAAAATAGTSFSVINYLIAATNLLPLYQQDGWKCGMVMLRATLGGRNKTMEWVFTVFGTTASIVILASGTWIKDIIRALRISI